MILIGGKKIADKILGNLAEEIKNKNLKLRLAAVMAGGSNSGVKKFLELKKKAAEKIGIEFKLYEFPENITTQKLRKELNTIVKAGVNSGVLVELPLPEHINTQAILNVIPEEKDVDVLSQKSQGAFFASRSRVLPPSVEAVKQIFENPPFAIGGGGKIDPKGMTVTVFGYGLLVGKFISHWLISQGATVSVITEYTKEPDKFSKDVDIIISGVGKPNLITADMVKDGAVVIDFGKDVDFENVSKKNGLITPHAGGVGPIVIAAVLKNLIVLNLN